MSLHGNSLDQSPSQLQTELIQYSKMCKKTQTKRGVFGKSKILNPILKTGQKRMRSLLMENSFKKDLIICGPFQYFCTDLDLSIITCFRMGGG